MKASPFLGTGVRLQATRCIVFAPLYLGNHRGMEVSTKQKALEGRYQTFIQRPRNRGLEK